MREVKLLNLKQYINNHSYSTSSYLDKVKSVQCRQQITKLRLAAHKGSFGTINNNNNVNLKCVFNCDSQNSVDSLKHYIMNCKNFAVDRSLIINYVRIHIDNDEAIFSKILNLNIDDEYILGKCISFMCSICKHLNI